jgi:DNA repair protein RecO (recombination protein O)
MLHKTRGIIISYIKFKETSIIVKVYTEQFGLQTYIENGVRSAKSKGKIALFQPLTLVDLVVYFKPGVEIQRISEIKCYYPFYTIPTDIKKSVLGIFVTEIISLTLKEHSENNALFSFLTEALIFLENHEEQIENFHLFFMLGLSGYLGFGPETAKDIRRQMIDNGIVITAEEEKVLDQVIGTQFGGNLNIGKTQRMRSLDILIDFYRINLDSFKGVKSLSILKEVLE